jgi:hypothetical protein
MDPNLGPSRFAPWTFAMHNASRPNIYLSSEYNQVHAKITVVDSTPDPVTSPKQAFIVAEGMHHNLSVEITSRPANTKIHICAKTDQGNIILRLPKDFVGPIKCHVGAANRGHQPVSVRLTPRVKQNLSAYSMEDKEMYAFVGDPFQDQTSRLSGSSPLPGNEYS